MLREENIAIEIKSQGYKYKTYTASPKGTEAVLLFESQRKTEATSCPVCGSAVHIYDSGSMTLRDMPIWVECKQELCIIMHRYRCTKCRACFTEEVPFKYPGTRVTQRAACWVRELLRGRLSIKAVQEITGIHWDKVDNIYIVCGYTDMRKSIAGLSAIIIQQFQMRPDEHSMFLFCGKRADRMKALIWEGDGFLMLHIPMKKILVTILTVAMMTSAVPAFADGGPQGGPMGGPMGGQPPRMEQGQQAPEKPEAAPEKPTGEKPADAPAEPEDLTGERPEMPSEKQSQAPTGERPEMPSGEQRQAPTGEKPADAPEMPSGEQGQAPQGQAPQGQAPTSRQPTDSQQAPKMIDFDAMVASGVISQETRDNIKANMDEHKPEGEMPAAPGEGETPAEGEPSLLNDLLNAGIITQTEYDAMSAAA